MRLEEFEEFIEKFVDRTKEFYLSEIHELLDRISLLKRKLTLREEDIENVLKILEDSINNVRESVDAELKKINPEINPQEEKYYELLEKITTASFQRLFYEEKKLIPIVYSYSIIEKIHDSFKRYTQETIAAMAYLNELGAQKDRKIFVIFSSEEFGNMQTLPLFWKEYWKYRIERWKEELKTFWEENFLNKLKDRIEIVQLPIHFLHNVYEWILAAHEIGHIHLHEWPIEPKDKILCELKADILSSEFIGPVFFEVLISRIGGEKIEGAYPPKEWRLKLISRYLDDRWDKVYPNIKYSRKMMNLFQVPSTHHLYENVKYRDIESEIDEFRRSELVKNLKNIKENLFEKYQDAKELAKELLKLRSSEIDSNSITVVLAGYIASMEKPELTKFFTQKVIETLFSLED